MTKNLLERLSSEVPYWEYKRKSTLSSVREFIKNHEHEIKEAREQGYSWKQIDNAVRELYEDSDLFANVRWWAKANLIEDIYGIMRRQRKI